MIKHEELLEGEDHKRLNNANVNKYNGIRIKKGGDRYDLRLRSATITG